MPNVIYNSFKRGVFLAAIENELNQAGIWAFWAEFVLVGGLRSIGTPFEQQAFTPGT